MLNDRNPLLDYNQFTRILEMVMSESLDHVGWNEVIFKFRKSSGVFTIYAACVFHLLSIVPKQYGRIVVTLS